MFDETNRAEEQELSLPENLFGDEELSETEEQNCDEGEENGNEGETTASEPESNENPQTLKIKYNGVEREISLDEARTLAQKGMNYDHVVQERDTRYKRELDALDKIAREHDMNRNEYVSFIENNMRHNAPQRSPEEVMQDSRARAREQIQRIYDTTGEKKSWNRLFERFPELDRQQIREELSENIRGGMTPLEAYQSRLLKQREQELRIVNNNSAAALRAVGSLTGDALSSTSDAFLEGFSING